MLMRIWNREVREPGPKQFVVISTETGRIALDWAGPEMRLRSRPKIQGMPLCHLSVPRRG